MLYDQSPSGKIYLMLADFTGHGFSAAIGALPTADIFFALTPREFSPIEILTEMNRKLRDVLPRGHFCAITFALIDPAIQQIDILNAGLPTALIFDEMGMVKARFSSDHIALGFLKAGDFKVEMTRHHYSANDLLVLYSDGVTEAQNESGEMFGEVRLMEALAIREDPLGAVKMSLNLFIGTHPPDDDISLITFRF